MRTMLEPLLVEHDLELVLCELFATCGRHDRARPARPRRATRRGRPSPRPASRTRSRPSDRADRAARVRRRPSTDRTPSPNRQARLLRYRPHASRRDTESWSVRSRPGTDSHADRQAAQQRVEELRAGWNRDRRARRYRALHRATRSRLRRDRRPDITTPYCRAGPTAGCDRSWKRTCARDRRACPRRGRPCHAAPWCVAERSRAARCTARPPRARARSSR